jgi:hypothetical protein
MTMSSQVHSHDRGYEAVLDRDPTNGSARDFCLLRLVVHEPLEALLLSMRLNGKEACRRTPEFSPVEERTFS